MKLMTFALKRLTAIFTVLFVGVPCSYGADILFNANNFPDPIFYNWLRNYVNTNYPNALSNNGQNLDPSFLTDVLQDLTNDTQTANQVTDLRCMKWFPSQSCKTLTSPNWPSSQISVDLSCFPQLKYIDLSGWKVEQVVDGRNPNLNNLEFLRLNNCKDLGMIEFSWVGRTDIFDLAGTSSLKQVIIDRTEINHPAVPGSINYCNAPRFRHLDFSSCLGIFSQNIREYENELIFGTYPQLTTMELPQKSNYPTSRLINFNLSGSLVSYLGTGQFLDYTDNVDVSNNRLINMNIIAPRKTAKWNLAGNNFSHIEVTQAGNTIGTVVPNNEASTFMPGMESKISTLGWDSFGFPVDVNGTIFNKAQNEIQWPQGAPADYDFHSDFSNLVLNVSVKPQGYPLTVALTSRYDIDPVTRAFVLRPTPLVYVFTQSQTDPNFYYSPEIPVLVGPYEIEAYQGNGKYTSPNEEMKCYPLKGHPKEATYNDEAELPAIPFKRVHNGVLQPDWWPVVMTDSVLEQQVYTLQAVTYFHGNPDPNPATIGAWKHDIMAGNAIPATKADLEFTTYNTWNGEGQVLYDVQVKVVYIEGNPLGKMYISAQKSSTIEEMQVSVPEVGDNDNQPERWYDLTGRLLTHRPSVLGVYIQAKGNKVKKIKI